MTVVVLKCEDFIKAGLWSSDKCCEPCHNQVQFGGVLCETKVGRTVTLSHCCKLYVSNFKKVIKDLANQKVNAGKEKQSA